MAKIICAICGSVIDRKSNSQKYCDGCKKEANCSKTRAYNRKTRGSKLISVPLTLDQAIAGADKAGMSYGKYIAMLSKGGIT